MTTFGVASVGHISNGGRRTLFAATRFRPVPPVRVEIKNMKISDDGELKSSIITNLS